MSSHRTPLLALAAAGGLTAALAACWLLGLPLPFAGRADVPALLVLPPIGVAWLVLGVGLLGLGAAVVLLVRGDLRVLLPVAALQAAVFGVALASTTTIALAGYLLALLLPLLLVVLVVQVVRRYPRLRAVVLLAAVAAVAWGAVSGALRPDRLGGLGRELAGGLARAASEVATSLLFAALAAGWVLLALDALRGTPRWERLTASVVRHRRGITIVAACGPLPYALARATWLTPWPQLTGPIADLSPEIRLWGVLLGGAALLGSVLTVGLVRPWGEVFPRWVPGMAGRPVPVRLAAVPGGVVAALLCTSAAPMAVAMLGSDLAPAEKALSPLLFPFAVWGPALALAVWGYVGARRAAQPVLAG